MFNAYNLRQLLFFVQYDFVRKNKGSLFGWFWSFARPATLLAMYAFALKFGFRQDAGLGSDFVTWLAIGVIAWTFISDINSNSTKAYITYKHVVSKVSIPIAYPPIASAISNLITHISFLVAAIVILLSFDMINVSIYWIQIPIITLLMLIFFGAWAMFSAPLVVVSKDFKQSLSVMNRTLIWVSGIFWNVRELEVELLRNVMMANPVSYIVEAYRKSLLYEEWIFDDTDGFAVFMLQLLVLIILADLVFKNSKKEIVDGL